MEKTTTRTTAAATATATTTKTKTAGVVVGYFQMPLHYPRYTKEDYKAMPEWKLDMLLAEYGLPAHGDIAYKREFAMGAFLWPEQ